VQQPRAKSTAEVVSRLMMKPWLRYFTHLAPNFFHSQRGLAMRKVSLRQNAYIVIKRKKDLSRFLYHTKDHLDFLQAKCDFTCKRPFCIFEFPFGGFGATYDVHLRLTGKRVVDFLLRVNWIFFHLVLPLRRYGRISTENRLFRSNGGQLTQNFG